MTSKEIIQRLMEHNHPPRIGFDFNDPTYSDFTGARIMKHPELTVRIDLARGQTKATVWTCDFSYDYVKINADYRS